MEESKAMQEKTKGEIAVATDLEAWGGGQTVTAKDVIIPKILPQQHMSEKVKEGKAKYGEFRDTLSNRLFGDLNKPFEVVPFYMVKTWYEFTIQTNKAGARKREFSRVIPIQDNATKPGYNDDLPYVDADGLIERDRVMDFYCLIPSEVEAGNAMPYVLSFRRTSLKAGQKLASQMFMINARAGKVPPAVTMLISGKDTSNDDGSFVVVDALPSRESTEAEIKECLVWLKMIRAGATKLDDSDIKEEERKRKLEEPIQAVEYGKF